MEPCDEVKAMWETYLATLPQDDEPPHIYMTWHFANDQVTADELGTLARDGVKTATASLLWEAEANEEELPQPGDVSIITDFEGRPLCIVETTGVEIKPFNQVDERQAFEEGEGDRSLAFWREVHWRAFSETCSALGRVPEETMPVVCERFRKVFPVGR